MPVHMFFVCICKLCAIFLLHLFICMCVCEFFFTQLDSLACCARMYGMLSCVFAVTVVF